MSDAPLPVRKKLPHDIPAWVPDGSRYFITINCRERGVDSLCTGINASQLLQSIAVYEAAAKWWMHIMVIMPDHLHMIATFGRQHGVRAVISAWKSYQARKLGIVWQSGFFEHRLRNDAEFVEKAHYVRMNPVRRGLVGTWKDWPYLFQRGEWEGVEGG
jgi:REP element-mobilizing transposase RayT